MATKAVTEFDDLTTCSLCLETFTKPKMLPCQHSYCYGCLLLLEKDKSTITCPCCKEEHKIPVSGISGFKDNLLLNHLAGMMALPKANECIACKQRPSVDECEHCQQKICSKCLVEHAKLSTELAVSLEQLKNNLTTSVSQDKRIRLETSRSNLEMARMKMNELSRSDVVTKLTEVKLLMKRTTFMDNVMGVITELYDILSSENKEANVEAYINELMRKSSKCITSESLKDLKSKLNDLKTLFGLIETQDEEFRFKDVMGVKEGYKQVEFGRVVVNVTGKYEEEDIVYQITQLLQDSPAGNMPTIRQRVADPVILMPTMTVDAETQTDKTLQQEINDTQGLSETGHGSTVWYVAIGPEFQMPEKQKKGKNGCSAGAVEPRLARDQTIAQVPTTSAFRKYNLQNQLPTKVNYTGKGCRADVVVIGQGEPLRNKLFNPRGCAYHVGRHEVFVADGRNKRIMAYSVASRNAKVKVFYTDAGNHEFWDVAVSSDSEYLYIAAGSCLIKVNQNGRLEKTISSFSVGDFKSCRLVTCYQEYTVVVDGRHQCVIVFYNDRDEELRCFGKGLLRDPTAVAISNDRKFYVADWVAGCVRVFDWSGTYLETFVVGPGRDNGDIWGIAVDGDGNVCVSRPDSHRIDVYSPHKRLITSISGLGKEPGKVNYPFGLCLTTGGKLIVTDSGNHRVQLF